MSSTEDMGVQQMSTPVAAMMSAMREKMKNSGDDLCDRCTAQALVQVRNRAAVDDLLFCGHHYRAHESALAASGWIVVIDARATA